MFIPFYILSIEPWLGRPLFFGLFLLVPSRSPAMLRLSCVVEAVVDISSSDSTGLILIAWYHWLVRSVIWDLQSFNSCWVNLRVKNGMKNFKSQRAKPRIRDCRNETSISSSVSSDKCSESIVWPLKWNKKQFTYYGMDELC